MARLDERMVAIPRPDTEAGAEAPGTGASLEGVFRAGAASGPGAGSGGVVAPPHPLYGGSLDSPVVNELCFALARRGHAALAFNWRGVGASSGAPSGEADDADEDYAAALSHLAETVPGALLACGYSFGAAAAVRAARHPRVERLVLVAPPPALVPPEAIAELGRPVLVLTGTADRLAPARALSEALLDAPDVRLEVIRDADHFFQAGLAELGAQVGAWLEADAPPA